MATGSDLRSRDPFGVPFGLRIRNRKLRNIRPSGAFWPEITLWNVTRSDPRSRDPFGVPLGAHAQPEVAKSDLTLTKDFLLNNIIFELSKCISFLSIHQDSLLKWKGVRMCNLKLRNIRTSGTFSPEVTSSNVTRRASPGSHVIGSALGVHSRTWTASYYRFLALSLVICPFY